MPSGDTFNAFMPAGVDVPDDGIIDAIFDERRTEHADDAIDYEDIDELADEEEDDGLFPQASVDLIPGEDDNEARMQEQADDEFNQLYGDDDEDDGLPELQNNHIIEPFDELQFESPEVTKKRKIEDEQRRAAKKQKLQQIVKRLEAKRLKRNIKYHYPGYSKNKPFNFHLFFNPAPLYYRGTQPQISSRAYIKPLVPTKLTLEFAPDERRLFKKNIPKPDNNPHIRSITQADLDFIEEINGRSLDLYLKESAFLKRDWSSQDKFIEFSKDLILSTTDWDDDWIINGGPEEEKDPKQLTQNASQRAMIATNSIDLEDYDDDAIFNGQVDSGVVKLDMNDPNLIFVPNPEKTKKLPSKQLLAKFNFSNDKEYEILKNNYNTKQRSQLSNLNIEHSVPALRLQTPYYKVRLTKEESRFFHRLRFMVRPNATISFSKLRQRKKKKDRGKSLSQIFSKSSDLTTTDTLSLIGMEYSEEYPLILSNFGMCSKLINYYRKEREDDTSRPKAPMGETHVLGVEDRSPFWNFGEVAPGDFVPTLYNNMLRAPIFKHEVRNTDFLLIQSSGAGNHMRHFLRPLNYMFAVGNVFPAVEVPAPHSRKVTNTLKNRLKMVVFRVMNKKGVARVSVKDVSRHFPDQNDMQNRQRLKEFMEYQRQGDDQGFWKIKGQDHVPTEDEIRTMITPEDCSLLDSMQHGQQLLEDIQTLFGDDSKKEELKKEKREKMREEREGRAAAENDDPDKPKKDKLEKEKVRRPRDPDAEIDIDEELAPWNLTRNFMISNQTKTMLQLNGEGDPSGIGLGFSLMRSTQKNGFHPLFGPRKEELPKNNTASHQQKLYEAEIKRIWYSQRSSLVDHGPDFLLQTIYDEYKPMDHEKYIKEKVREDWKKEEKAKGGQSDEGKVLKITRRVRDENGIVHRKVETVTDPRLIKAYIRRRKVIEDELLKNADVGDILPTNDKELNKIRKRALENKLANFIKRSKQSKAKKPPKFSLHAAAAAGGKIIDANTVILPDGLYAIGGKGIGKGNASNRRCTLCGAFGHIKTKKTCPMYHQTKGGTIDVKDLPLSEQPPGFNGTSFSPDTASATPDGMDE